jgi:quercetin 2,3-dioxygenase
MSNIVLHKADTRSNVNMGWLRARHTFSFANYYNPERVHFGVLRVLNDDIIAPSMGFGMHPHDNMEIITIPLTGSLKHRDNMGNEAVIRHNEVQIMSAGTGVMHSEFNASSKEDVSLLQIWLFPNKKNVTPRYDQREFKPETRLNAFQTVVSPMGHPEGLNIHQDAWFSLGTLKASFEGSYDLKRKGNGVYAFLIDGKVTINGQVLNKRDAVGISGVDKLDIVVENDAEILLMDIPMDLN